MQLRALHSQIASFFRLVLKSFPILCLIAAIGFLFPTSCGTKTGRAVILISIDTLRPDHLGCYGYGRSTSPNIDRFAAEEGILFTSAYSQAPYTLTSHMSMLTGLYPEAHGIFAPMISEGTQNTSKLKDAVTTMAESLGTQGFFTSAFTDGILLDRKYGFDQGFAEYRDERNPDLGKNGFRRFGKDLQRWIRSRGRDDFFLFIHTYDTHSPYLNPPAYEPKFSASPPGRDLPSGSLLFCEHLGYHDLLNLSQYENIQDVVDAYDRCISFVDDELGNLFSLLKEVGLWEDALIVVTSDHGESFMENQLLIGHGMCATTEEIRVPLIMKLPGERHKGRSVDHVVELVDLMPTILAELAIPIPEIVQGQNVIEGLDKGRWAKNYAYGIVPYTNNSSYFLQNGYKFIEGVSDPSHEMIMSGLLPTTPATAETPKEPYYILKNKRFFYDFDEDPLGVKELVYRGDRIYDLREGEYEWEAVEVEDRSLVSRYKEAALSLSRGSEAIFKGLGDVFTKTDTLTDEEKETLSALGYGGLLVHPGSGRKNRTGGASSLDVKVTPALVNRTLLDRGDAYLWKIYRFEKKRESEFDPMEMESMRNAAYMSYREFLKRNPDRTSWVDWRMKSLDLSSAILDDMENR